jgi:hypothetical protein
MTSTKQCSTCRCDLPLSDFHKSKRDGHQANCKSCNIAQRQRRLETDPRLLLLEGAKRRAKRLGIPCTLELQDIVVPSHCPILGLELRPAKGAADCQSPTLDRIRPGCQSGYSKKNTRVISMRANTLKSDLERVEASKRLAQQLINNRGNAEALAALIDQCVIEADLIAIEEGAA